MAKERMQEGWKEIHERLQEVDSLVKRYRPDPWDATFILGCLHNAFQELSSLRGTLIEMRQAHKGM
jgi:hypothetical protein